MRWIVASAALVSVLALGTCGGEPAEGAPHARVRVAVRPLQLDGVTGASWRIAVTTGSGDPVWSEEVTSEAFGDGAGSLAYVGPCDASDNDNVVALELLALRAGASTLVDGVDYQNPAPPGDPVTLPVTCRDNADVPVTFDVTVMRRAHQGFFDIGVDFEDIFCSAKVDCEGELLFDPLSGARARTIVVAFACASGSGEPTFMHLDDVTLGCTGLAAPITIDVAAGPGQLDPPFPGPEPNTTDILFQAATYRGAEAVGLAQGVHKAYWNVALGINEAALPGAGVCPLTTAGTASAVPWSDGISTTGWRWPVVRWNVPLAAGGAITCGAVGLDAGDELVTYYAEEESFDASFDPALGTTARHTTDVPPALGRAMVFPANDPTAGRELWVTDCTDAGTHMIDVNPAGATPFDLDECLEQYDERTCSEYQSSGACDWDPRSFCSSDGGSSPHQLIAFDGYVYFQADDGTHGRELWRTDGTTAELIDDLAAGAASSFDLGGGNDVYGHLYSAVIGSKLYFFAKPDGPFYLHVTDGSVGPGSITRVAGQSEELRQFEHTGTSRGLLITAHEAYTLEVDGALNLVTYAGGRPPFDRIDTVLVVGDRFLYSTWGQSGADITRLWAVDPGTSVAKQIATDGIKCPMRIGGLNYVAKGSLNVPSEEYAVFRVDADQLIEIPTTRWFRQCDGITFTVGERAFFPARFMDLAPDQRIGTFDGTTVTALGGGSGSFGTPGPDAFFASLDNSIVRYDAASLAYDVVFAGDNMDSFAFFPAKNALIVGSGADDERTAHCVDVGDPQAPVTTRLMLGGGNADPRTFTLLP